MWEGRGRSGVRGRMPKGEGAGQGLAEEGQVGAEAPPTAGETSGRNGLGRLLLTELTPRSPGWCCWRASRYSAARRAGDSSPWGRLGSRLPLCGRAGAVRRRGGGGGGAGGGRLTGRVVLQFLTELTRLFQKCRSSGSVFITLKKCKQPPGPRGRRAGGGQPGGRLLSGSTGHRWGSGATAGAPGRGGARRCAWCGGPPAPAHRDRGHERACQTPTCLPGGPGRAP